MNSYSTNRIEGQHTHPADIQRAMRKDFDAGVAIARKQRLAVAHIELEEKIEREVTGANSVALFSSALVCDIHRRLYEKLPQGGRVTEQGEPVEPGHYRRKGVKSGLHVAPPWEDVQGFMEGWAARYGALPGKETLLIGAACAHHRLA